MEPGAGRHQLRRLFAGQRDRWLSVESIYQAIYDPAVALTRPARRRRRRRRLRGLQRRGRLTAMRMIAERPPEAQDRLQAGHWEGDLIMGPGNRSAIGTLIERSTPYLILVGFPTLSRRPHRPCRDRDRICRPAGLVRRTLTWDQGKELALHQLITAATGLDVFFCDAHAPWQRASNENMNGLLRDYFPKAPTSACTPSRTWPCRGRSQRAAAQDPGLVTAVDLFTTALQSA